MANPYRHPDTNAFISREEYAAIMAERNLHQQAADDMPLPLSEWMAQNPEAAEDHLRCDPRLPFKQTPYGAYLDDWEKRKRGVPLADPNIQVIRDEHDQTLRKRQAACDGELPEWESPDPLRDLVTTHSDPSRFTHRLLNSKTVDRVGKRKWEEVRDKDGNVVRYGAHGVLARMPKDLAAARARHFEQRNASEVQDVREKAMESAHRLAAEIDASGSVIRDGETVRDYRTGETRTMGSGISQG
jgi:hypothetical protein